MAGRGKITNSIVQYLRKNIQEGEWKVGERIPSENQLCQELGVSRVSVRNALHQLITLGILQSVHGKGTFVISGDMSAFEPSQDSKRVAETTTDMEQLLEFRAMIEPSICEKVARDASPQLMDRLAELLQIMQDSIGKPKEFVEADNQFHLEICYACDNPVTTSVMTDIFRQKTESQYVLNLANGYYAGLYYHSILLEAFRKHDDKRARAVMLEHLQRGVDDLYTETDLSADH